MQGRGTAVARRSGAPSTGRTGWQAGGAAVARGAAYGRWPAQQRKEGFCGLGLGREPWRDLHTPSRTNNVFYIQK